VTHPYYPSGNPRFNHVAMSVPADLLDEEHRRDLCRYFKDVLGFDEMPTMTLDRKRMIMSCVHWDQFIFLIAENEPMTCPRMDHYGFAVASLDDLVAVRDRALEFKKTDDRVDLIDLHADDQGPLTIHSIYIKYQLPMMCELQWWEFAA
jgi:hypothetical protein